MIPDSSLSRRVSDLERRLRETERELRSVRQMDPSPAAPRERWLAEVLDDYTIGNEDTVYRVRLVCATASSTPGEDDPNVTQRGSYVSAFGWPTQAYAAGERVIVERFRAGLLYGVPPASNTEWVITTPPAFGWAWQLGGYMLPSAGDAISEGVALELLNNSVDLSGSYVADGTTSGNCGAFYARRLRVTRSGLYMAQASVTLYNQVESSGGGYTNRDWNARLRVETTSGGDVLDGYGQGKATGDPVYQTTHCGGVLTVGAPDDIEMTVETSAYSHPGAGYLTAYQWSLVLVRMPTSWSP